MTPPPKNRVFQALSCEIQGLLGDAETTSWRKKLSKKRVVVGVYSACGEFQHLKPQMHQGRLVILWNTSLNLPFYCKLIWMRHRSLSSKLQSTSFVSFGSDFYDFSSFSDRKKCLQRRWPQVVDSNCWSFFVKKMDQNQRRRLKTSGVAAMGKKPAAQKMSLAAAWWWHTALRVGDVEFH